MAKKKANCYWVSVFHLVSAATTYKVGKKTFSKAMQTQLLISSPLPEVGGSYYSLFHYFSERIERGIYCDPRVSYCLIKDNQFKQLFTKHALDKAKLMSSVTKLLRIMQVGVPEAGR